MFKQQGKQEYTHFSLHGELAVSMLWKPLFSPLLSSGEKRGKKYQHPHFSLLRIVYLVMLFMHVS